MVKTFEFIQVDAFTDRIFGGNPAAVVLLDSWLEDSIMQDIAMENNLSETAFLVKERETYRIRWFTPAVEVALCGHATLASAHVLFNHYGYEGERIEFDSLSGPLGVSKVNDYLVLDFPCDKIEKVDEVSQLERCLNTPVEEVYKGKTDYLCILENEALVRDCEPDMQAIRSLKARGIIISAEGSTVDFVSRFFGPASGVDEDPVTGSAHTSLTPYWSKRLSKNTLTAKQISSRGGDLKCTMDGVRVKLFGQAKTYAKGVFYLND